MNAVTRPANSPAQPEPVSWRPMMATRATAAAMAITEGTRRAVGLPPISIIQKCISR